MSKSQTSSARDYTFILRKYSLWLTMLRILAICEKPPLSGLFRISKSLYSITNNVHIGWSVLTQIRSSLCPVPHLNRNLHRGVTSSCLTQMIQKTLVELRLSTRELLDCPTSARWEGCWPQRGRRQSLAVPDENQIPPGRSELHIVT